MHLGNLQTYSSSQQDHFETAACAARNPLAELCSKWSQAQRREDDTEKQNNVVNAQAD